MGHSLKFRQGFIAQEGAQCAVRTRFTPGKVPIGQTLAAEGAVVFAKVCELGLEGIRLEARGQLLQQREKPQLAEDEEPELRQNLTAIPRDWGRAIRPSGV